MVGQAGRLGRRPRHAGLADPAPTSRHARPTRPLGTGDWGLGTGDWRLETGDWGLETGDWRLGTGDWRLETGDWRLETGDWRLETGDCLADENLLDRRPGGHGRGPEQTIVGRHGPPAEHLVAFIADDLLDERADLVPF